jgi:hypothetical protein
MHRGHPESSGVQVAAATGGAVGLFHPPPVSITYGATIRLLPPAA